MEKLKDSWIRVKKSDSQQVDLPCHLHSKNRVVMVFDYQSQELPHNAEARSVRFRDQYWYY